MNQMTPDQETTRPDHAQPHELTAMLRTQTSANFGTGAVEFDSSSDGTGKDD